MRLAIFAACCLGAAGLVPSAVASGDDQDVRYDRATVIDFMGRVEEVREVTAPPGVRGVHLIIQSEGQGRIDTYLGPTVFVRDFLPYFEVGSVVQVIGSKVKVGGSVVVLARQVRKGEITLSLRDDRGTPYWIT